MERFMGLLGIAVFVALGWAFARDRQAIHWRTVGWGLALQWSFAVIVLKGAFLARVLAFLPFPKGTGWGVAVLMVSPAMMSRFSDLDQKRVNWTVFGVALLAVLRGNLVGAAFDALRLGVVRLMACANAGAGFVFGPLANPAGAPVLDPSGAPAGSLGMIFAFVVLPTIIFIASIFAVLYHLGVMQRLIGGCARTISRFLLVGGLLGKRMVVNELVAFIDLGRLRELSAKARLIATFALCGFANVSSIAIQVGGIGALAPERRGDLARLGVKAMLAGSMANAISACIAGILG